jgi:hypothetical protein
MADEAEFRLWNPQWHNCTVMIPVRKDKDGNYPMCITTSITEAASAVAEIGTAADAVLDGTTTPVQVVVVSSQANDDNDLAAADAQRVHLIGISVASSKNYILGKELPVYSVEEINLNGTSDVTSTRYYLRVMHAYCCKWGTTGSDAVGNITVEYPANTTKLTIDAGSNESNSSGLIYLAANYEGRWTRLFVSLNDAALNQA